jgi:DNA-binding response OmpR family regulator
MGRAFSQPSDSYGTIAALPRILLIEDEVRLATALKKGLEDDGFTVDVAIDGDEGWWQASERDHDVIILDVMLPGRSGHDICRSLRAAGKWTPILMLTAKSGEQDEATALDIGADDFLTKPFSYMVLLARVRALLRRGAQWNPPVLQVADLQIDPARHRCVLGEREVTLTRREFEVLEYLARRAGHVVSKAQLLDAVWDYAYSGDPNIVEVYVSFLRRKLEGPSGRKIIHTVRGIGYRLDVTPPS